MTNFGPGAVPLPRGGPGAVLLPRGTVTVASAPLETGLLPADTTA